MHRKGLLVLMAAIIVVGLVSFNYVKAAVGPFAIRQDQRNSDNTATLAFFLTPPADGVGAVTCWEGTSGGNATTPDVCAEGTGIDIDRTNGTISVANVPQSSVTSLVSDLASKQDSLPSQSGNSGKFLTTNGSVMSWDTPTVTRSFNNNPGRSFTTSTGAAGFQISSTRDASVSYGVSASSTASIGGNASSLVVLEIAPTNSATPGDWIEVARCGNSQTLTLAIALQSVQVTDCTMDADVPAGYYVKLRNSGTGTHSETYRSGQEVQL